MTTNIENLANTITQLTFWTQGLVTIESKISSTPIIMTPGRKFTVLTPAQEHSTYLQGFADQPALAEHKPITKLVSKKTRTIKILNKSLAAAILIVGLFTATLPPL